MSFFPPLFYPDRGRSSGSRWMSVSRGMMLLSSTNVGRPKEKGHKEVRKRRERSSSDVLVAKNGRDANPDIVPTTFDGIHFQVPVTTWPEFVPILEASSEDSLFDNNYNAAVAFYAKFSCPFDRRAIERFSYVHSPDALQDVIGRDLLQAMFSFSYFSELSDQIVK
ncbi:uncharacterized protein G2W53_000904 [Senna tora]|uniref:Uncharacterized protein n=1 Tax=Senna tora TaxID=362788 RepID=A0A834XEW6_9FABA|nr:uncharacterized protein G2W53_000904 [Senna tora]